MGELNFSLIEINLQETSAVAGVSFSCSFAFLWLKWLADRNTWYPEMCCIKWSLIELLVRTKYKTLTAAYIVCSSVAKEMRPRRMVGPPMKSRLLAAGRAWNILTPVGDKGEFHQYINCFIATEVPPSSTEGPIGCHCPPLAKRFIYTPKKTEKRRDV